MFCGKCGKEMDRQAKFCPYCGAENPNAAPAASTSRPAPAAAMKTAGVNLPRLVLIVLGALQVLMFFVLSYGKLTGLSSALGQLSSRLGIDVPQKLTALSAIKIMKASANISSGFGLVSSSDASAAYATAVIAFGLPLVMGILVLLLNCLKSTKKCYVISAVLTVVTLIGYLLVKYILGTYTNLGYSLGSGFIFACLVTVVQLIAAVVGCMKNNSRAN